MENEKTGEWSKLDAAMNNNILSASCSTDKGFETEANWFLQPLKTSAKTSELCLSHCGLCKRIILSERFHLHACQISSLEKACATPQSHPPKRVSAQNRASQRKGSKWDNARTGTRAAEPRAARQPGSKKKSAQKKGQISGNKRKSDEIQSDTGLKGPTDKSFYSANWDMRPGLKMKTRKLTDVLKNGPKSIPCHLVPQVGQGLDALKSRYFVQEKPDNLYRGQGSDWWGGRPEWAQAAAPHAQILAEPNKDCSQINLQGELVFPSEVRKQRSTHPIRRSRYPSPSSTVDEGPDVLIDTSSLWYTVAFDPLNESLGSVTVLGCG